MSQSYDAWELIIVDDCSTDDTALVAASFVSERIRFERLAEPSGANVARNRGVALARGEYVAFLDDDDLWLPEKLSLQMAVMEKDQPPIVRSPVITRDAETGRTMHLHRRPRWPDNPLKSIFHRNFFGTTSTILCKREALVKAGGFDENLPMLQDLDLIIRLFMDDPRFGETKEALVIYAIYSDRKKISSSYPLFRKAGEIIGAKYHAHPCYPVLHRYLFRIFIGKMARYAAFRRSFMETVLGRIFSHP